MNSGSRGKDRRDRPCVYERNLLTADRADLKAGRFQALIAHATDRLSRNPIHLAILAEECDRAGVELIFVTEPLDSQMAAANSAPRGIILTSGDRKQTRPSLWPFAAG